MYSKTRNCVLKLRDYADVVCGVLGYGWVSHCDGDCVPSVNSVCAHRWEWITGEEIDPVSGYMPWAQGFPEA